MIEQDKLRSISTYWVLVFIVIVFSLFLKSFIQNRKANKAQQVLNESLNISNRKLTESNAQLEQFAHTASHDLKSR